MRHFLVDKTSIKGNTIELTNKEDIHHIRKVLRLDVGDSLLISDSEMFEYTTKVIKIEPLLVKAQILDKQRFSREPDLRITLFQSIPKQSKMETVIQKAVEIGTFSIVPVFTERTIVTEKEGFKNKLERWKKIASEAAKQSKRGIIPEVTQQVFFSDLHKTLSQYDLVLIPYEGEDHRTIKEALRSLEIKPKTVAILIGPEGGFAEHEVEEMIGIGGLSVTLGKTVLRTETAGLVAAAMVFYELEL